MTGTPDTNPYGAPVKVAGQAAPSISGRRSWSLLVIGCGFLLLNIAVLAVAQSSLADLLVEFEIQLSTVSSLAYRIAKNWVVSIVALLIFTVCTTLTHAKLQRSGQRFVSRFFMLVISIWTLFTIGFAFGVFQPLYNVITGLTD